MTGRQKLVWLITGCSSGLGATLAEYLLTVRRDKVIATARNPSKLGHLNTLGADILALDLTARQSELTSIIERAIAAYGRIDVLVNNASFIQIGTWEDLSIEDLQSQFETNVFGTVKVTKALLPHFRTQKAGTIVFISSLSGWIGHASCGAYAGSKFALEGLVESLHAETQHLGIKTLIIEPGRFRTNLLSPGNMKAAPSRIPDYAELNAGLMQHLTEQDQAQPGDPQKLIELIVDLVKGEGMAEGRKVPFRLPVGADCVDEIKGKCEQMLNTLNGWNDIIRRTDFQAEP